MTVTIKGELACPACQEIQAVKYDGRKYFINCKSCGLLSNYQSKAAKTRIEAQLSGAVENAVTDEEAPRDDSAAETPEEQPQARPGDDDSTADTPPEKPDSRVQKRPFNVIDFIAERLY
ncbi:MAG: hypothetical protein KTR20_14170 [Cellvibrionaceae bacterium]|nr:hypothetical protein [Cellvibrionaceae bacterium]